MIALLLLLSANGCQHPVAAVESVQPPATPARNVLSGTLAPSPRLITGRIVSVDTAQAFALVELTWDAPAAAIAEGSELIVRTLDLRETARLLASRYVRGRILGTKIVAGQPTTGDEVVWHAP